MIHRSTYYSAIVRDQNLRQRLFSAQLATWSSTQQLLWDLKIRMEEAEEKVARTGGLRMSATWEIWHAAYSYCPGDALVISYQQGHRPWDDVSSIAMPSFGDERFIHFSCFGQPTASRRVGLDEDNPDCKHVEQFGTCISFHHHMVRRFYFENPAR